MYMECQMMGTTSCCLDNYLHGIPWQLRSSKLIKLSRLQYDVATCRSATGSQKLFYPNLTIACKSYTHLIPWKSFSMPISLEESSFTDLEDSNNDEESPGPTSEELIEKPLSSDELKALLIDSERTKLLKKLSEANQHNRFLKRQLHVKENALVDTKSEMSVLELEIQALVPMAEEIANYGIPEGSRKINGKYIQSHLLSRLEALREKLKEKIRDVDGARSKEVSLFWSSMAESVQVMGSFDGWSQGEHLSPEYTGSFTKFSTTLMLRPGRYEIKFLVDGEWYLSPDFPTVGEGLMENNLLVVE